MNTQKRIAYKNPTGNTPWIVMEIPVRSFRNIFQVWNGKKWVKIFFMKLKK